MDSVSAADIFTNIDALTGSQVILYNTARSKKTEMSAIDSRLRVMANTVKAKDMDAARWLFKLKGSFAGIIDEAALSPHEAIGLDEDLREFHEDFKNSAKAVSMRQKVISIIDQDESLFRME